MINYFCICVETGKEYSFKNKALKMMEAGILRYSGNFLIFSTMKKIVKRKKVYDELMFPGYVFLKTAENDLRKIREISSVPGFIKFLPKQMRTLYGRDLELLTSFERGGELQGFLRVRFDENDKVVIVSKEFQGLKGAVTKVCRRNHKLRYEIQLENGIKILNLSYYDVEKQDWSLEEQEYRKKKESALKS